MLATPYYVLTFLRFCAPKKFTSCFRDACVALHFCGSIRNLRIERFRARHRLLQIRAIDRERQVWLRGLEPLDVRERGIFQLDDELLAVKWRRADFEDPWLRYL